MKVSIITACLNNEDTVESCINSLIRQDYDSIEHIVKDGGSTDGTLDKIRTLSPNSIILSNPDSGLYDALNQAMIKTSGDIFGILHSDDFYMRDSVISAVVNGFENTGADAVYGDLMYVDRLRPERIMRKWKSGSYQEGDFLKGWMPPHPAFFVKKEIVEKFGNYNLDFKLAADYEWMLRLIHKHRISMTYIPEFLVAMRTGGNSNRTLKNRINANFEDRKAWRVNGLRPRWYSLYIKPLRKIQQYF